MSNSLKYSKSELEKLSSGGKSNKEIREITGIPYSTIARYLPKNVNKKLTPSQKVLIFKKFCDTKESAREIAEEFGKHKKTIETIFKRFHEEFEKKGEPGYLVYDGVNFTIEED